MWQIVENYSQHFVVAGLPRVTHQQSPEKTGKLQRLKFPRQWRGPFHQLAFVRILPHPNPFLSITKPLSQSSDSDIVRGWRQCQRRLLLAYFSVSALSLLGSLWAVYIQFPSGWNFVFPFLLLRLLFFLKIGGHFRQKCVFVSLLPLWLGLGPFWKEGNFHFVYKEGLVFFGYPINLLGREFGVPRTI